MERAEGTIDQDDVGIVLKGALSNTSMFIACAIKISRELGVTHIIAPTKADFQIASLCCDGSSIAVSKAQICLFLELSSNMSHTREVIGQGTSICMW